MPLHVGVFTCCRCSCARCENKGTVQGYPFPKLHSQLLTKTRNYSLSVFPNYCAFIFKVSNQHLVQFVFLMPIVFPAHRLSLSYSLVAFLPCCLVAFPSRAAFVKVFTSYPLKPLLSGHYCAFSLPRHYPLAYPRCSGDAGFPSLSLPLAYPLFTPAFYNKFISNAV
jgi:hypothetical protein